MTGRHGHRCRILLNDNLLRAGLCLLLIGISTSCTSLRSLQDGLDSVSGKSTGMCSEMLPGANGWTFRANEFLLKSEPRSNLERLNGIFPSSESPAYSTCEYVNKLWHNVILGEYALTATGNAAFMTTPDNVCSARPTIHIHRFVGDWQMPERTFKPTPTQIPEEYTDPTYSFYVGSHNASWITTPNAIEKNLLLVRDLIAKQCGAVPNEIRISGRFTEMPRWKPGRRGQDLLNTYKSQEIYRGTYYPTSGRQIKIVHDDAERARTLLALASARQQGIQEKILATKKEANARLRQAEIGGALVGIMLLLLSSAGDDPCANPYAVNRPYHCN